MKKLAALSIIALTPFTSTLFAQEIKQDFRKDANKRIDIKTEAELPKTLIQATGFWKSDKVYGDMAHKHGLHINTGKKTTMKTHLKLADGNTSHVLGVHGKDTVVHYHGKWQADGFNSHPNLVMTKGSKFVIEPDAHIDFVMAGSFYTRQLWAYGDGTGTIEIAEGFIADRTKAGTVPDACGTIRLNGVNLITHHSQNLPYNTRPDGRGGVYPNGHIVWEGKPGSVWTVKKNQQLYRAQLDFHADGEIKTESNLVHAGHVRITSPKMVGGVFVSTGAFRTCEENVTITKTGAGMLALEGQQGYYPGAKLHIKEGYVRMNTNPGNGYRYDKNTSKDLVIVVEKGAKLLLGAEKVEVKSIHIKAGAELFTFPYTNIHATEGVKIEPGAKFDAQGTIHGSLDAPIDLTVAPGKVLKVKGELKISGAIAYANNRRLFSKKNPLPESITLIEADKLTGTFNNISTPLKSTDSRVQGTISIKDNKVVLTNIELLAKPKKNKKKK